MIVDARCKRQGIMILDLRFNNTGYRIVGCQAFCDAKKPLCR